MLDPVIGVMLPAKGSRGLLSSVTGTFNVEHFRPIASHPGDTLTSDLLIWSPWAVKTLRGSSRLVSLSQVERRSDPGR